MSTVEHIVYMANQIAANLATDKDPVRAIVNHIELFWDPRMKALIKAHGDVGLSPNAAAAIEQIAKQHGPG
ncbi:MAG: formate dehydrogenase subunit delta [Pseudomonadota bacterium]